MMQAEFLIRRSYARRLPGGRGRLSCLRLWNPLGPRSQWRRPPLQPVPPSAFAGAKQARCILLAAFIMSYPAAEAAFSALLARSSPAPIARFSPASAWAAALGRLALHHKKPHSPIK